jgi:hypothetical protein
MAFLDVTPRVFAVFITRSLARRGPHMMAGKYWSYLGFRIERTESVRHEMENMDVSDR